MYLEIVSPEATLFKGDVDSVSVPGVNGEFEMLNNHAAVVSTLKDGFVKIILILLLYLYVHAGFPFYHNCNFSGTFQTINLMVLEKIGHISTMYLVLQTIKKLE